LLFVSRSFKRALSNASKGTGRTVFFKGRLYHSGLFAPDELNRSQPAVLLTRRSRKRQSVGSMRQQVILLHPAAPPKPAEGRPCNGCGVCCAAEPCPLGQVLSRRRRGACTALQWSDGEQRYHCGVVAHPERFLKWLPASWGRRLALRWISAARGCDSDFQPD
jgi:hypothetical protein